VKQNDQQAAKTLQDALDRYEHESAGGKSN
jgi:hypothetical protein